jgi:hypothetical protein
VTCDTTAHVDVKSSTLTHDERPRRRLDAGLDLGNLFSFVHRRRVKLNHDVSVQYTADDEKSRREIDISRFAARVRVAKVDTVCTGMYELLATRRRRSGRVKNDIIVMSSRRAE